MLPDFIHAIRQAAPIKFLTLLKSEFFQQLPGISVRNIFNNADRTNKSKIA